MVCLREGHFLRYICLTISGRCCFCQRFGLGPAHWRLQRDCPEWKDGGKMGRSVFSQGAGVLRVRQQA